MGEAILTALIVGKKTRRCSSGFAKGFDINDDEAERQGLYHFWNDVLLDETARPSLYKQCSN